MQTRILKLLKDVVGDIGGSSSEKLVDLLFEKKNVNEFIIAKKMNLTINQTRNILYKLGDEGLVSFIRKKDKKKGGWYTYFWTLDVEKSLLRFKDKIRHEIDHLQEQLAGLTTKRFYFCVNCNIEYNEESALLHEYTCPECGEVLVLKNPEEQLTQMRHQIKKKEDLLAQIQEELDVVQKKAGQVRERRIKAEIKKKAAERAAKRQKGKAARAAGAPKKVQKNKQTKKKVTAGKKKK